MKAAEAPEPNVPKEGGQIRRDIENLHQAQTTNNQNYPRAWHDAIDAALEIVDAGLSVEPVAPIDGWKWVPIEPTIEMVVAGRKQTFADMAGPHMGPSAEGTYGAMVQVAPQPPIQPSKSIQEDEAVQPSHAAACLTMEQSEDIKQSYTTLTTAKVKKWMRLDQGRADDEKAIAISGWAVLCEVLDALTKTQPLPDKPSEPNIPESALNAAAQAPDAATPGGGTSHLRTPDAAAPDVVEECKRLAVQLANEAGGSQFAFPTLAKLDSAIDALAALSASQGSTT